MERPTDNPLVRLKATFEGQEIDVIWLRERPHWLARQVGAALGYAEGGRRFADKMTTDWSDEIAEGDDRILLTGEDLAALKALRPDLVDPRTPSLLLLTQSGVFAAVMLSRQPLAATFRRWLSREVLPQLAETGTYQLQASNTAPLEDRVRLQLLLDLHTAGDISPAAFAKRTGEMLKADAIEGPGRDDVIDELVRLAGGSRGPTEQETEAPASVWEALARHWFEVWGSTPVLLSDLPGAAKGAGREGFQAAIMAIAGRDGVVSTHLLGNLLRRVHGKVFGGLYFERATASVHGSRRWRVMPAGAVDGLPAGWKEKVKAWVADRSFTTSHEVATQVLGLEQVGRSVEMQVSDVLKGLGFQRSLSHRPVRWVRMAVSA